MGFLEAGTPMEWDDPAQQKAIPHVKQHGIDQLLHLYHAYERGCCAEFLWGDEVEYTVVTVDEENKTVRLTLRAHEILADLAEARKKDPSLPAKWAPEFGEYMLEGIPAGIYDGTLKSMASVEDLLNQRHKMVQPVLKENERLVALTNFPLMGVGQFTDPPYPAGGPVTESLFCPDQMINPHPRFGTLARNIRKRRGGNVCIMVPLFIDKNTQIDEKRNIDLHPRNEDIRCAGCTGAMVKDVESETLKKEIRHTPTLHFYFAQYLQSPSMVQTRYRSCPTSEYPSIYMDAMPFGMGSCCLQETFQMASISQARHTYDQLAVLCPIMVALSAATPYQKGLLAQTDVRWMVISASVDDRKGTEVPHIMKSRYDSISQYISNRPELKEEFNDINPCYDQATYDRLVKAGLDSVLAKHFAHLFIRDPLVIFSERIEVDDKTTTEHFENIQSTNWQTVRFKPPPLNSGIGWRVEFRVMDVQSTDFENAAYLVFIALITKCIVEMDLLLYIPLSSVDQNMALAHEMDAVLHRKFHWRKDLSNAKGEADHPYKEMTVDEIINGSKDFEGLIPIVRKYVAAKKDDLPETLGSIERIELYLEFLSRRACGKLPTNARYWRDFILNHADYKQDSKITEPIAYDIVQKAINLTAGRCYPTELFGDLVERINKKPQ